MASAPPLRLLRKDNGGLSVFKPGPGKYEYDIMSYTWGKKVPDYKCGMPGVDWNLTISEEKLEQIKRLMDRTGVQYMWVDCICINQDDDAEKDVEMTKMYAYYKNAQQCHIMLHMNEVWDPQDIVNNLKLLDHLLYYMGGAALASEARLTENLTKRLSAWEESKWAFGIHKPIVQAAAIETGILNCYSTCINYVKEMFLNEYFTRVWTFQEMLLGKKITMWAINNENIFPIGELNTWMDLATDSKDKAYKLLQWIEDSRELKSETVEAIQRVISEDFMMLDRLQAQVKGINSARTDIVNGGPDWWYENHKGISNIFSAVALTARDCQEKNDIFKGLLGVFNGLFSPEEIKEVEKGMSTNDIEKLSFAFFKQLSIRTGYAWTKLAMSSGERGEWDWIPVVADHKKLMTTDCFSGVVNLGPLKNNGQAKAKATTGLKGFPKKYMKIRISRDEAPIDSSSSQHNQQKKDFQFIFKGCNCGKRVKTGVFSSEIIPTNVQPKDVFLDDTGRILVQCATILGSILDPGSDVVGFRNRLLTNLQPYWKYSDPNAKPPRWIDRCVSGTFWEDPNHLHAHLRPHNRSMNYRLVDMLSCESRLENESTANTTCEIRVNCGCTIIAPFSFIFEGLTAVYGSFLGEKSNTIVEDNRIVLRDGLGLVQVGNVGKAFDLVAFEGDVDFHKSHAASCRNTKVNKPVERKKIWPQGRALVREEFNHDMTDMMRDYGYVETGCGNLLICRNSPLNPYKIIGACIDNKISQKKESQKTNVRIR